MPSGEKQGSDVGKGDAGNQVVPFKPGAKTKGQGYHTWDHKRLSSSPFTFAWLRPQKGQPAPPPIGKDDPKLANWKPGQGMPEDEVFCRQDGLKAGCPGCLAFSTKGKKTGKKCSSNVLTVNGMPMPACPKKRFGPGRIKSKRDYLTGEDPPGWARSWYPVICDPAPSQRRQKRQKRQPTTNDKAFEASGDVLPTSAPAGEQQVQPSNVVLVSGPASLPASLLASGPAPKPAAKPAPQQPLQPLNVEPTVEQPQQQATGLDVLVQVMGESAQPSKPREPQQPSDKPAMVESVGDGNNIDIPDGFVTVFPLQDNFSNSTNDSWKSLGRFIDGVETHADTADTADAQAIPGMSLDDASDL